MRTQNRSSVQATKGSGCGHVFRRIVHVSMLVIPLVYYAYDQQISQVFFVSTYGVLLILLAITLIVEAIRLRFKWVIFGQRFYEARYISAFTWGMVGILLVLLISPSRSFSIPIIWCLALVDPLLGELRSLMTRLIWVECVGVLVALAIWWLCGSYWLGLSLWWGVFLAPITVAVESIKLKWIDDNALMLLVPLIVIKVALQWAG